MRKLKNAFLWLLIALSEPTILFFIFSKPFFLIAGLLCAIATVPIFALAEEPS